MSQKLKPEHRKLWRRIWLMEYEQNGCSAEASEAEADKVVAQWEARGAFDDVEGPQNRNTSPSLPEMHHHLRIRFAFHESGVRPSPGDKLVCCEDGASGIGIVTSYRIHHTNKVDVHVIALGGNPNVGAMWQFETPRPGIVARGTVMGESSGTHEPCED